MDNMTKKIILFLIICFSLISCGKKVEDGGPSNDTDRDVRNDRDIQDDESLRKFIAAQAVTCEDEDECPESVAKLVIIERQTVKYCTGTLIGKNTIMTSSSCLPKSLKIPGINCEKNIFAFFPKTSKQEKLTVKCDQVISSNLNNPGDPALLRNDFAFIKLKVDVPRYYSYFSRKGFEDNTKYQAVKVDYINDYDAIIREKSCSSIYDSFANPFSTQRYSPLMTVSECGFSEGNGGAPIFNFRGFVVGIYSSPMDKSIGSYVINNNILSEPMADIHHVSNMACAEMPSSFYEFKKDKECSKEISIALLDSLRRKILSNVEVHKNNMLRIKKELETPLKYFKWDIKFYRNSEGDIFEPHIEKLNCFYDINSWVDEFKSRLGRIRTWVRVDFTLPHYTLATKLNRVLQPVSIESKKTLKDYSITFNPRYAFFMQNTTTIVSGKIHGEEVSERFDDITNICK